MIEINGITYEAVAIGEGPTLEEARKKAKEKLPYPLSDISRYDVIYQTPTQKNGAFEYSIYYTLRKEEGILKKENSKIEQDQKLQNKGLTGKIEAFFRDG